jgi:hypothetical protein
LSFILSFAPTSRDFVPVIEKLLQSLLHENRRQRASEKSERRLVVYFIAQDCSIILRLDYVPMAPASKGSFDLHIFKQARRIINGVLRNPPHGDRPKNLCFDDCLRANF